MMSRRQKGSEAPVRIFTSGLFFWQGRRAAMEPQAFFYGKGVSQWAHHVR